MRIPDRTSWTRVLIAGTEPNRPRGPLRPARSGSTVAPLRQRHHVRFMGRQTRWIDLLVAGLGPLPDADRCPQVLAGVLGVFRPVTIGYLESAASQQRS